MEENIAYTGLSLPNESLCCEERPRRIDDVIEESQKERKRTKPGQKVDRFDAGWYVFDDLTQDQAEDLLSYHGNTQSYLVINNSSLKEWIFHVKISDDEGTMFHQHTVNKVDHDYLIEGMNGAHSSLDEVEQHIIKIYKAQGRQLSPLFHDDKPEIVEKDGFVGSEKTMTISRCFEPPPEYKSANRYPQAPVRSLPTVKPFEDIKPAPLPRSPKPVQNPPVPEQKKSCCCTVL